MATEPDIPITQIIRQRYSCRRFMKTPIAADAQVAFQERLSLLNTGPLGSQVRFTLSAATQQDHSALRGLGTYGFIKNATGFIIGAVQPTKHGIEDFGYAMEQAVLEATVLGLGTCWLGGTFTKSSFAQKIDKQSGEIIPAVIATGYADPDGRSKDVIRRTARSDWRLPWENLFFEGNFSNPLLQISADKYAEALEMVRIGPSASNKQPWRIVRSGKLWHFYCQRTPGYGKGSFLFNLANLADVQRLDIGIAMCHFELTLREQGQAGEWVAADPLLESRDGLLEYMVTWQG
jgi:nitroreductase